MTKVIIQIPCFNEEKSLPITLADLPRTLPGVDRVEWLIINDGSRDKTSEVAKAHGVDHIVELGHNQGLARAFQAGLRHSLKMGADIIVNTDADNQYCADDIPKLIEPILQGRAQIVVGARPIRDIRHFSFFKKIMQGLGSWVVRKVSDTDIPDAPSGFRAFSREAALRLNVFSSYTYTLETLIQAGRKGIPITWVPIRTNPFLRPSRLMRSMVSYMFRSLLTIVRIFITYKPLRFFTYLGSLPFLVGFGLGIRWIVLFFLDPSRTHLPSLILAAILLLIGFMLWVVGVVADLLSVNRSLLEELQVSQRARDWRPLSSNSQETSHD
jgi:glycosyltransferase involved in cell wall biosynthesis